MAPTRNEPSGPLLLDATGAARLLSISRSGLWKLHSQGRLPAPLRLSTRVVRWRRDELERWIDAGCPTRDVWEQRRTRETFGVRRAAG